MIREQIALANSVGYRECLDYVKQARSQGLKAPVLLMGACFTLCPIPHSSAHARPNILLEFTGYYNPLMSFGEEEAVKEAKLAGANGFIVVDLPPEEAVKFREICKSEG